MPFTAEPYTAKKIWLPIPPRNFGSHMTVRPPTRPPVRNTGKPKLNSKGLHILIYCAFHKHANSKVQEPPSQLRFFRQSELRSQATNLETQKQTKRIEIHQSQITNHDLLNPFR